MVCIHLYVVCFIFVCIQPARFSDLKLTKYSQILSIIKWVFNFLTKSIIWRVGRHSVDYIRIKWLPAIQKKVNLVKKIALVALVHNVKTISVGNQFKRWSWYLIGQKFGRQCRNFRKFCPQKILSAEFSSNNVHLKTILYISKRNEVCPGNKSKGIGVRDRPKFIRYLGRVLGIFDR